MNYSIFVIENYSRIGELECYLVGTLWDLGRFEAWDVMRLGCLGAGTFWGLGRFGMGTYYGWDVSRLGRFKAKHILYLGCFEA